MVLGKSRERKLVLAYRTTDQAHCPHDAKLKMAGFKDRYECAKCQKIMAYVPPNGNRS
jgi:ribosomal protein S27AE